MLVSAIAPPQNVAAGLVVTGMGRPPAGQPSNTWLNPKVYRKVGQLRNMIRIGIEDLSPRPAELIEG